MRRTKCEDSPTYLTVPASLWATSPSGPHRRWARSSLSVRRTCQWDTRISISSTSHSPCGPCLSSARLSSVIKYDGDSLWSAVLRSSASSSLVTSCPRSTGELVVWRRWQPSGQQSWLITDSRCSVGNQSHCSFSHFSVISELDNMIIEESAVKRTKEKKHSLWGLFSGYNSTESWVRNCLSQSSPLFRPPQSTVSKFAAISISLYKLYKYYLNSNKHKESRPSQWNVFYFLLGSWIVNSLLPHLYKLNW